MQQPLANTGQRLPDVALLLLLMSGGTTAGGERTDVPLYSEIGHCGGPRTTSLDHAGCCHCPELARNGTSVV